MDWNNDGKKDLILGEGAGYVRIYLNSNTDADPVFDGFQYVQVGSSDHNFGEYSAPYVIDWNNDGKKDLLVGENTGYVFLLINTGTDSAPVFTGVEKIQDGGSDLMVDKYASPMAKDWNKDGAKDLLIGTEYGTINYYENIGSDSSPVFDGGINLFSGGHSLKVSSGYVRFETTDWNNDGVEDVLSGEYTGDVFYFQGGESNFFPDLKVHSFSGPSQADPLEMVGLELSLEITNLGKCPTNDISVCLYLSEDPEITSDDEPLFYGSFVISDQVNVGALYTVPIASYIKIPDTAAPGLYYLGPLLDVEEVIWELDEENNYSSYMIKIGDPLLLEADTYTIPEAGGTVNFSLDAGTVNGNRKYLLVGGITGSSPGMLLPGGHVTLPVNWDLFSDLEIMLLNTIVFSNFLGILDADGTSPAQMNLPELPTGSAGTVISLAYCLNNPFNLVSNVVEVELVP